MPVRPVPWRSVKSLVCEEVPRELFLTLLGVKSIFTLPKVWDKCCEGDWLSPMMKMPWNKLSEVLVVAFTKKNSVY